MEKSHIVEALGEEGLRLPALLNEALAANDRAKYLFTVLQVAQGHAEHPGGPPPELRAERDAAGLAAASFDEVAAAATKVGEERYFMPGVDRLCARLHAEVDAMLAPLQATGEESAAFSERRARLPDSRGATRTTASARSRSPRSPPAATTAPTRSTGS